MWVGYEWENWKPKIDIKKKLWNFACFFHIAYEYFTYIQDNPPPPPPLLYILHSVRKSI